MEVCLLTDTSYTIAVICKMIPDYYPAGLLVIMRNFARTELIERLIEGSLSLVYTFVVQFIFSRSQASCLTLGEEYTLHLV